MAMSRWFLLPGTALLLALWAGRCIAVMTDEERVDRDTKLALHLDVDRIRGANLFLERCAACHGMRAQGNPNKRIPALAGQRFNYLVRQLANFSYNERDSRAMHAIAGQVLEHQPQAWVDVAGYLNRLTPTTATEIGAGTHAALGRGIFHEQCASCHKLNARGDEDGFVPSLRNQHYSYLLHQIENMREGRRHNLDEDLQRFLQSFDARDIEAVADYLSRQHTLAGAHRHMRDDGSLRD